MSGKKHSLLHLVSIVIISLGFLFVASHALRHAPAHLRSAMVEKQTPENFDFPTYEKLIETHVQDGLVDYASLKSSPLLDKALDELARTSSQRMEEGPKTLAYWINAYNLLTIKLIADKYPIDSVKQVSLERVSTRFTVGGEPITIDDIKNRHVRRLTRHAKIIPEAIFLLAEGALGYPPLTDHVLKPDKLRADAQANLYRFIKRPDSAFYDPESKTFYISPVFSKYEEEIAELKKNSHDFVLYFMDQEERPPISPATKLTYFRKIDTAINEIKDP